MRNAFIHLVYEHLTVAMKQNGSLRNRTLQYMFSTLNAQLGALKAEDIDALLAQLRIIFEPPESMYS